MSLPANGIVVILGNVDADIGVHDPHDVLRREPKTQVASSPSKFGRNELVSSVVSLAQERCDLPHLTKLFGSISPGPLVVEADPRIPRALEEAM
jgi:hypothetical protein